MRSKKTYREYREDDTVKFPAVSYVLDRKALYITFSLIALLAFGLVVKVGWDSYNKAIEEPEVITPYLDMEPASSPGRTWAAELTARNPAGLSEWAVSENTKPQTVIDSKYCSNIADLSTSLLSTHKASGSGVETRVQVYGAGQAFKQFEAYTNVLDTCFNGVSAENVSQSTVARFPGGFLLTAGDGIVGVTAPEELIDSLIDFYVSSTESTLTDSKCVALNVYTNDAFRSFFYDRDSYTGLEETKPLETQVNISGLPTPTEIKLNEIANTEAIVPEAPLPADFPVLPKKAVEKPSIPGSVKDEAGFAKKAAYKIADFDGPGCGWEWSAQAPPVYSKPELESARKAAIKSTQESLDVTAQSYVRTKVDWALQIASILPKADRWNSYVNQTNSVHEKWYWLEAEREALRPAWFDYIAQHEEWSTFDARKAEATRLFDEASKKCEADEKALEEWEDKWGKLAEEREKQLEKERLEKEKKESEKDSKPSKSPSPSPTPSASPSPTVEIPEKPAGCDTPPERTEIMDQEKPAEPIAPDVPKGVTIPQSWPNP